MLALAARLQQSGIRLLRGGAYKPRTSPYAFQGLKEEGLRLLAEAREETGLAVVTEVVAPEDVPLVARYADVLQIGDVQKVLQHLLRERVPIRDMAVILETMADFGGRVKDPDQLGELVRSAIGRTITRQYLDTDNKLFCITLEPVLERSLAEQVSTTSMGSMLTLEPATQRELIQKLQREVDRAASQGCRKNPQHPRYRWPRLGGCPHWRQVLALALLLAR